MSGLLILGVEECPAPSPLRPPQGEGAGREKGRADSPDSGGGGYFTLSDSDLGTESPQGSSLWPRTFTVSSNSCFPFFIIGVVFLFLSAADPWHFGVDPDPSIFIIDLQDANKIFFFFKFFCILLLKVLLHHFSKVKSQKEVTKQ